MHDNSRGKKLVIPAKTNIELYENGIVKSCECSNQVTVKQTTYTYNGYEDRDEKNISVKFNKDGSIRALCNYYSGIVNWFDTFYSDGSIKRTVTDNDVSFYSPQGHYISKYEKYIYYKLNGKKIWVYLQNGDKTEDLGMIYFDDTGKASSYSLLKRDKDGKLICDEFGFPLFEETKKRFIYK